MAQRTTIILDDETRLAAREVAIHFNCSVSEAIRRSVLHQREFISGVPEDVRRQRVQVLHRLFDMFEGHDPDEEVRRLKAEDSGF